MFCLLCCIRTVNYYMYFYYKQLQNPHLVSSFVIHTPLVQFILNLSTALFSLTSLLILKVKLTATVELTGFEDGSSHALSHQHLTLPPTFSLAMYSTWFNVVLILNYSDDYLLTLTYEHFIAQ